jgi:hypothetical protein
MKIILKAKTEDGKEALKKMLGKSYNNSEAKELEFNPYSIELTAPGMELAILPPGLSRIVKSAIYKEVKKKEGLDKKHYSVEVKNGN